MLKPCQIAERIRVNSLVFLLIGSFTQLPVKGQKTGKILDYSTVITVENNELVIQRSYLFEAEDKQSDWLSDISISYQKSSKIEILDAYVTNSKGEVVRKLAKKEIITKSDIDEGEFFKDYMVKEFSLRWSEYPYFVNYSYRITEKNFINLADWTPLLSEKIGTEKASLKIILPLAYKTSISYSGNLDFKKDSVDDKYVMTWEASGIHPIKKEKFAPPDEELLPEVRIVPLSFTYGDHGNLDSWNSLGKWLSQINKGLDTLTLSEQLRVTTLLKGVTDRMEIMKKLYHYMQDNTHYVYVSFDIGGLKSYPASYVCENKYGDCKALTMYMKALLKFAGIESFYTIINAGKNAKVINKEYPSDQFNHVILCVPCNNDTIWLENTSNLMPFGYLGPFTQNRYALLANGSRSRLVRTPSMNENDFLVHSVYHIRPNLTGTANVHLVKEMRGEQFEYWLRISSEESEEDQKIAIIRNSPIINDVTLFEFSHPDRDQRFIKMTADLKADNIVRKIGNSLVFNMFNIRLTSLDKPENRKYPVRINIPENQIDSLIYDIPNMDQYDVELPSEIKIDSKFGSFNACFNKRENQVIILSQFLLHQNEYPPEYYNDLYAFIDLIKKTIKKSGVVLNKKI